jgi:hypothetical protein
MVITVEKNMVISEAATAPSLNLMDDNGIYTTSMLALISAMRCSISAFDRLGGFSRLHVY